MTEILGDIRVTLDDHTGDKIRVAQTRTHATGKGERRYCVTMTIEEAKTVAQQILRRVAFAEAAARQGLT